VAQVPLPHLGKVLIVIHVSGVVSWKDITSGDDDAGDVIYYQGNPAMVAVQVSILALSVLLLIGMVGAFVSDQGSSAMLGWILSTLLVGPFLGYLIASLYTTGGKYGIEVTTERIRFYGRLGAFTLERDLGRKRGTINLPLKKIKSITMNPVIGRGFTSRSGTRWSVALIEDSLDRRFTLRYVVSTGHAGSAEGDTARRLELDPFIEALRKALPKNGHGILWTKDPQKRTALSGRYMELPPSSHPSSWLAQVNPLNPFRIFWDRDPRLVFCNNDPSTPRRHAVRMAVVTLFLITLVVAILAHIDGAAIVALPLSLLVTGSIAWATLDLDVHGPTAILPMFDIIEEKDLEREAVGRLDPLLGDWVDANRDHILALSYVRAKDRELEELKDDVDRAVDDLA